MKLNERKLNTALDDFVDKGLPNANVPLFEIAEWEEWCCPRSYASGDEERTKLSFVCERGSKTLIVPSWAESEYWLLRLGLGAVTKGS